MARSISKRHENIATKWKYSHLAKAKSTNKQTKKNWVGYGFYLVPNLF